MVYALMSGGGKNSILALDRARRDQLEVGYLMTVYAGTPDRARFHGTHRSLIERQAQSLGLEPIAIQTAASSLETTLRESLHKLAALDVNGVIFGDISLKSVRAWYEERVNEAGLEYIAPNWGYPSIEIAWEFVERGYQACVVSVNRAHRATKFLGREFDSDMVTEIGCTDGLDPCGERGEYHTFVFDGPAFGSPVNLSIEGELEFDGHKTVGLIPSWNVNSESAPR